MRDCWQRNRCKLVRPGDEVGLEVIIVYDSGTGLPAAGLQLPVKNLFLFHSSPFPYKRAVLEIVFQRKKYEKLQLRS